MTAQGPPCIDNGTPFRLYEKEKGGDSSAPFGFLIRDVAESPSRARRFLQRAPEVVEELADERDRNRSRAIMDAYLNESRSCLIWFISRNEHRKKLLYAIYYVYLNLLGDSDVE